ncbi:hypothetical protein AVEN_120463-1 [Araneus ventricosus]|uniref:Uncharacterized protein n=1 Tax=Araneus ventricosus TaxID=182803 RepID=A0A4Y2P195_ARAVE|nr:hypothetical protein AVEN_120463-1 [Araneus ventricosus]
MTFLFVTTGEQPITGALCYTNGHIKIPLGRYSDTDLFCVVGKKTEDTEVLLTYSAESVFYSLCRNSGGSSRSLVHSSSRSFGYTFTRAHAHSNSRSLEHTFTRALVQSSTRSFEHPFNRAHVHSSTRLFEHTFTRAHVHSSTRSLEHTFTFRYLLEVFFKYWSTFCVVARL